MQIRVRERESAAGWGGGVVLMYFMLACAGAEQREGEREAEMAVKREEMRGRRGSEAEMAVERERTRWACREGG